MYFQIHNPCPGERTPDLQRLSQRTQFTLSAPTLWMQSSSPCLETGPKKPQLPPQKGHHSPSLTHHHRCLPSITGLWIFFHYEGSFGGGCEQGRTTAGGGSPGRTKQLVLQVLPFADSRGPQLRNTDHRSLLPTGVARTRHHWHFKWHKPSVWIIQHNHSNPVFMCKGGKTIVRHFSSSRKHKYLFLSESECQLIISTARNCLETIINEEKKKTDLKCYSHLWVEKRKQKC